MDEDPRPAAAGEAIVQVLVEETEMILTAKYTKHAKSIGRAGSPLPAARANANDGAHGVPRPAERQFLFRGVRIFRGFANL